MTTRDHNAFLYQNHQRAAELHEAAAHVHRAAEQHGQQDHLTGHEHSRQALEHSREAHQHTRGLVPFGHSEIAALAHQLWEARGRPEGSAHDDWFHAAEKLRSGAYKFGKQEKP